MNRFDKILWRINGVIILIFIIIGVVIFGYSSIKYIQLRQAYTPQAQTTIPNKPKKSEVLHLGISNRIEGSDSWLLALNSRQENSFAYSVKSASAVRNYLFFNHQNSQSHWLLDNNQQLVVDYYPISQATPKLCLGFIFVVLKNDTNNDGLLTDEDKKELILTNIKGEKRAVILQGVDELNNLNQLNEESLIIFYKKDNDNKVLRYNFQSLEVIQDSSLPSI